MSNMQQAQLFFIFAIVIFSEATEIRHVDLLQYEFSEKWYKPQTNKIVELLTIPQIPHRYLSKEVTNNTDPVLRFGWENCGKQDGPVTIKTLGVSPDPMTFYGYQYLTFEFDNAKTLYYNIQLEVTLYKKVGFIWVKVPCISDIGSCSYADVCNFMPATCPRTNFKTNIPCGCEWKAGSYSLTTESLFLTAIPSWIPVWSNIFSGDYKAVLNGSYKGEELFCTRIKFTLDLSKYSKF